MEKAPAIGLGLVALTLAACGGSSGPGVALAPGGSPPAAITPPVPAPISTPKPPSPLSTEPVIQPPVRPPPARLVVKDLIPGTGALAKSNQSVTVNYVGALYKDGKVFDSSWSRRQTFTAALSNGSVISGLVAGIRGERVGGRRELIIPPNLAYGSTGSSPKIPPNSTLIFDVDLLSVSASGGEH
jgi:peptidylprolyl isomerase